MASTARRPDALSRDRIVTAAIEMLDTTGESGLTFRALAAHLQTGPGALYWHIANKDELLAAATDAILTRGSAGSAAPEATPQDAIRSVALSVYNAVEAHPWIGTQLARLPTQRTVFRVFERLGAQIQALQVPKENRFYWASALLYYITGVAAQNAGLAREVSPHTTQRDYFKSVTASLNPAEFPFTASVAPQLETHNDRDQFMAGIDLLLAGIETLK